VRIFAFSYLTLAIIVSLWLDDHSRPLKSAIIGAAAFILFFLPNPSAAFWTRPIAVPAFFAQGLYRKYIAPGDTVLILPYGVKGESDVWQGMSGMYFTIAGGYVSIMPVVPSEYMRYLSAVREFYKLDLIPNSEEVTKTFLAQKNVRAVIVTDEGDQEWHNVLDGRLRYFILTPLSDEEKLAVHSIFATLGVEPIRVGGSRFIWFRWTSSLPTAIAIRRANHNRRTDHAKNKILQHAFGEIYKNHTRSPTIRRPGYFLLFLS
jgi:hypothetical protein